MHVVKCGMRLLISTAGIVTSVENRIEEDEWVSKVKVVCRVLEEGVMEVAGTITAPWLIISRLVVVVGRCWSCFFSGRRPDSMNVIGL